MKTPIRFWPLAAMFAVALGAAMTAVAASKATPKNLVKNGDFAHWKTAAAPTLHKIRLLQHKVPAGWPYIDQDAYGLVKGNPKFPTQGAIGRSAKVKKQGCAYALLIQNGLRTDITDVSQMIKVKPDTAYRISVWVKGSNIQPSARYGGGAFLWAVWGPKDYWSHQHFMAQQPKPSTGTFDWRKFTFTTDTGKGARHMMLRLQLRCASGKVWFDQVSVVEIGKITSVKGF